MKNWNKTEGHKSERDSSRTYVYRGLGLPVGLPFTGTDPLPLKIRLKMEILNSGFREDNEQITHLLSPRQRSLRSELRQPLFFAEWIDFELFELVERSSTALLEGGAEASLLAGASV